MADKEIICPEKWRAICQRYTFSPGVKKGNMISMSTIAVNYETGEFIGEGDIVAQTRQCYKNIQKLLEEANASMADVVQTTDYIRTTENYKQTAAIRREYFGDSFPSSVGIIVAGLINPKALIEMAVVALVDD